MNVLLLGSGGREHALAWKLAQSPLLDTLLAAPGNPGIAQHAELVAVDVADHRAVADLCREREIGLVVIGPEAPLVDGLVDSLRSMKIPVFGPGRAAAQIEGSKGFTKDLCARHGIPTARYVRVSSREEAGAALGGFGVPVVIKADGLAAGKGVVVAMSEAEAREAVANIFADASGSAVIEEYLEGEEASLFAIVDERTIVPFGSAQDHKRAFDGDEGPNTGGMGAYSPASVLTPELERRAIEEIVRPTVEALADEGMPYSGVLYAGLMLTAEGPKLIEYNARFGDPECQVLMMRLESDLLPLMLATAERRLEGEPAPVFSDAAALTVVLAARGYPGTPEKGGAIEGVEEAEAAGAKVFHAGTAERDGGIVANGGRVLAVTATGAGVREARDAAYETVAKISFPAGFHRGDIGWREIGRHGSADNQVCNNSG